LNVEGNIDGGLDDCAFDVDIRVEFLKFLCTLDGIGERLLSSSGQWRHAFHFGGYFRMGLAAHSGRVYERLFIEGESLDIARLVKIVLGVASGGISWL
jgi:hypothetical protein